MGARVAQAHHSLVRHSSCKMASEVDQVRILAPQMDRRTVCGMLSSTKLMLSRLIAGIPQSLIDDARRPVEPTRRGRTNVVV